MTKKKATTKKKSTKKTSTKKTTTKKAAAKTTAKKTSTKKTAAKKTKKKVAEKESTAKKAATKKTKKASTKKATAKKTTKKATAKKATTKTTTKKSSTKKAAAKTTTKKATQKAASKKTTSTAKKAAAKKATTKRAAAKSTAKTSTKKATTKATAKKTATKAASKKTTTKKTTAKATTQKATKTAAKKSTAKKATTKKATTKKATAKSTTKKATTKKAASKKTTSTAKKAAAKKATTKKAAAKSTAKASTKKTTTKSTAKKASTKAASKKSSTKKTTAKKAKTSSQKAKSTAKKTRAKSTVKQAVTQKSKKQKAKVQKAKEVELSAPIQAKDGEDLVEQFSRMVGNFSTANPKPQKSSRRKHHREHRRDDRRDSRRDNRRDDRRDNRNDRYARDDRGHRPNNRDSAPRQHRQNRSQNGERMVRVQIHHPDVVAGGGYIEDTILESQVRPGMKIISEEKGSSQRSQRPRREHRQDNYGNSYSQPPNVGAAPAGGIISAGRLRQAKIKAKQDTQETPKPQQPKESTSAAPKAPEASQQPKTSASTTPEQKPTQAPSIGLTANASEKAKSSVGSSFLQGLPTHKKKTSDVQHRKAFDAVFSSTPAPSKIGAKEPSNPLASTRPISPPPQAPKPAVKPRTQVASTKPAPQRPTPQRGTTQPRSSVVINGRVVSAGAEQESDLQLTQLTHLNTPADTLKALSFTAKSPKGKHPVDAHVLLWKEGDLDIKTRVNDSDPRPKVWAEEGIRGLGISKRLEDLQRWSLREWWDNFAKKGQAPMAAAAMSRAVRDSDQVAFVQDPEYQIYRLFQSQGTPLSGTYPMVMFSDGKLSFSHLPLDGIKEKERITYQRMDEILGEHAPKGQITSAFTAVPFFEDGISLDLQEAESLLLLRDQLEYIFRFPVLELPDPMGGTGSIKVHLGLWEMSQKDANAAELRQKAIRGEAVTLQASSGVLSDLVRRELWRLGSEIAEKWTGYTPKQIQEAIRIALRENHSNMQGFQPKSPGDYCYSASTGAFDIVLHRKPTCHTLLLQGISRGESILGLVVLYGKEGREGLDFTHEYGDLLHNDLWQECWPGVVWVNGWLTAPAQEGRCMWAEQSQLPVSPIVKRMPDWHRGVAQGLFLLPHES